MDLGAGILAVVAGLIVKTAVMIFGGWLLVKLYRASHADDDTPLWLLLPKENQTEIKILWWSLVLFAVSEVTCGIEIYVFFQSNPWLSGCHAITSALGMALFALGVTIYLDKKLFRYGEKACLVNRICRGCTIDEPPGCKYRTLLMLIATFVALAAIAPFFAPTERVFADPTRWVLPFESWNAWYDDAWVPWLQGQVPDYEPTSIAYSLPPSMLVIELRIEPAVAGILALVSVGLARAGKEQLASKVLAFAVGVLCYVYFEFVLLRGTGDVYIASLGHEVVEFWFLVAMAEFLRRSFPIPAVGGATEPDRCEPDPPVTTPAAG